MGGVISRVQSVPSLKHYLYIERVGRGRGEGNGVRGCDESTFVHAHRLFPPRSRAQGDYKIVSCFCHQSFPFHLMLVDALVRNRIQKELAEITLDPPCNCSAGPKGDDLYNWVSTIMGMSEDRRSVFRLVSHQPNIHRCTTHLLSQRIPSFCFSVSALVSLVSSPMTRRLCG